jgi:hypothetical protein
MMEIIVCQGMLQMMGCTNKTITIDQFPALIRYHPLLMQK